MKKRVIKWLALALAAAVFLTACAPSAAQPGGESGPSVSASQPEEEPERAPESEPTAPVSQPEEEPEKAPESEPPVSASQPEEPENTLEITEDGWYNTKDEVALYIHQYNRLPENYVTKNQAQKKGWSGGSVEKYTGEGTAIGGSRFGNYEGLLPEKKGRSYTECDINTVGKTKRGAERIIFSNDGLVYYTGDHYKTFELLYGEP